MLGATGELAGARAAVESSLAIRTKLAADHPSVTAYQSALAMSHNSLGKMLGATGELAGARAAVESSLAIWTKLAADHPESPDYASNLGATLSNLAMIDLGDNHFDLARDRLREAVNWQKKALAPNPRNPTYRRFLTNHYTNLRIAAQGLDDPDLLAEAERGLAELKESDPTIQALNARLVAVLQGEQPKDTAERLALAQRAYDTKRHALAARLWAEALEADPKVAGSRQPQHRYNAACAAALAASGQGIDDPPPDDAAQVKLRAQALGWLKAELATWTKFVESGPPQAKALIVQTLKHWVETDTDLASIRDAEALEKLPEEERQAWTALWADVAALRAKTEASATAP
jgi:tetratricopeptide (TPR) repeat protein